jgi:SAM-dependent methyltransferase
MDEAPNPSGAQQHWDRVFSTKSADEVSWYRPHLEISLDFIRRAATKLSAPILDVGAGESTLVDDLLAAGYTNLTLLDISQKALDDTRGRLGPAAARVTFLCADLLTAQLPPHHFRVWHDRAVFHFLTSPDDRAAYVAQATSALRHGGHVILATFAPNGPTDCSGLPVQRHDAPSILREFGPQFTLVHTSNELHTTPSGVTQPFVYCDLLLP